MRPYLQHICIHALPALSLIISPRIEGYVQRFVQLAASRTTPYLQLLSPPLASAVVMSSSGVSGSLAKRDAREGYGDETAKVMYDIQLKIAPFEHAHAGDRRLFPAWSKYSSCVFNGYEIQGNLAKQSVDRMTA